MDEQTARQLLQAERDRVTQLLEDQERAARADRSAADEPGDMTDSAAPLVDEAGDDAVREALQERLEAIERAEGRLASGTYGRSIRSGRPIPDERLEADPAAELTIDEAEDA